MAPEAEQSQPKPVRWVGTAKKDASAFPAEVRRRVGGALWEAQIGRKAPWAKLLRGYGGAAVLEVVANFDGDTFRAVHTVRVPAAVYVLHAFQKKSRRGIETPMNELIVIEQRLGQAKQDYETWLRAQHRNSA